MNAISSGRLACFHTVIDLVLECLDTDDFTEQIHHVFDVLKMYSAISVNTITTTTSRYEYYYMHNN